MYVQTIESSNFYRYPTIRLVGSPLDPIEDLLCWISGLNSIGYNSDILMEFHNFKNNKEIKESAKLISLFSNNAVGLIEQAYAGPSEMSFLPLYYSILNLSKIYIIIFA